MKRCLFINQRDEAPKEIDLKEKPKEREDLKEGTEDQAGLLSKISGGVYNKAASVVGGVGWVAGTALSTTFTAVSVVGGVALTPFRKSPKDKSD